VEKVYKTGKTNHQLNINSHIFPKVLFLGNGMLKLDDKGISWKELLQRIQILPGSRNVEMLPMAMQPEALCGVDAEEVQRKVANETKTLDGVNPLLHRLLELPFDAVITTNYTYEIEETLSGKEWTEYRRRKSLNILHGSHNVNHNTFICNMVETKDGHIVPVFHIHGERSRKHSMILSYYSYANSLARLVEYNKILGNQFYEHQIVDENILCRCWLDYFIMGDIISVGFGLDLSEFDVWWALERKAREIAKHGKFVAYIDRQGAEETPQKLLMDAMDAECRYVDSHDIGYEKMYEKIVIECEKIFLNE
jgi:hypothetical protein